MATETYPIDVSRWIEVEPPADHDHDHDCEGCRDWFTSTNQSQVQWRVYLDSGHICAEMFDPIVESRLRPVCAPPFPLFEPKGSRGISETETYNFKSIQVSDGWIVGYYRGEFGGHLCWYGDDGVDTYKITNHNVVQFFAWLGKLYAIEGCAHLGIADGSLLRLERDNDDGRWTAVQVLDLDDAPYSVVERESGSLLITLSKHIVEVRRDMVLRTILDLSDSNFGWSHLYPKTSVLSADEQKLYIGMRQFVAELDIRSGRLRYLLPSLRFISRPESRQLLFLAKGRSNVEADWILAVRSHNSVVSDPILETRRICPSRLSSNW